MGKAADSAALHLHPDRFVSFLAGDCQVVAQSLAITFPWLDVMFWMSAQYLDFVVFLGGPESP